MKIPRQTLQRRGTSFGEWQILKLSQ